MHHNIISRLQIFQKLGRNLSFGTTCINDRRAITDFYYLS